MQYVLRNNKRGLIEIDEQIYVPMFGFKDTASYYKAGTLAGRFNKIKVPTFGLSAMDD